VDELNQIVRSVRRINKAAAAGRLMKNSDRRRNGADLYNSPSSRSSVPWKLAGVLRHHPRLPVRMVCTATSQRGDRTSTIELTRAGVGLISPTADGLRRRWSYPRFEAVAEDLQQNGRWRRICMIWAR